MYSHINSQKIILKSIYFLHAKPNLQKSNCYMFFVWKYVYLYSTCIKHLVCILFKFQIYYFQQIRFLQCFCAEIMVNGLSHAFRIFFFKLHWFGSGGNFIIFFCLLRISFLIFFLFCAVDFVIRSFFCSVRTFNVQFWMVQILVCLILW